MHLSTWLVHRNPSLEYGQADLIEVEVLPARPEADVDAAFGEADSYINIDLKGMIRGFEPLASHSNEWNGLVHVLNATTGYFI